ncbi:MAG: aminoglycoside 6-adenylyltransferase [Oscillospiraceae bacterium]|nr:aminoglycoside 6-adenylyltransferase [Oscillospiraceae bacterium]
MRTEQEMLDLIIGVAKDDERIRAVLMSGSRADSSAPRDSFMDYDIEYFVHDVAPFYDNLNWLYEKFGKPAVLQLPESNTLPSLPPIADTPLGEGHCTYLALFEDGNRIDLSIVSYKYTDNGEPAIVLLDKDNGEGFLPKVIHPKPDYWHIKPPTAEHFRDCCNEFWWCLNNVAKGIARDELPYAKHMFDCVVRDMLDLMLGWFIGVDKQHNFAVSAGKQGKYFKRLLPPEIYENYCKTYSDSNYENFWAAVFSGCELFRSAALRVAGEMGFCYDEGEERGSVNYLNQCRNDNAECRNEF